MQAHQLASATTFTSVVAIQGSEICTCYVARFERKACNTSTAHGILCSRGWVKRWRHSRCWGDRLPFALLGCIGVKLQQLIFHGQVVTQLRNLCRGEKKGGSNLNITTRDGNNLSTVRRWRTAGSFENRPSHLTSESYRSGRVRRTSSLTCSTWSSSSSFLSLSVLFFFSSDCPMRAANSRSRSFCRHKSCDFNKQ